MRPVPLGGGSQTAGQPGAPGAASAWIFRRKLPVRPKCHMSAVPSPGSRAHAGRPLRQREGKWGSLSLPPKAHDRGAGGDPPARESTGPPRLKPAPLNFPGSLGCRKAPLRLSSSVAREADFTEEMGYFLLVFFFFFFKLKRKRKKNDTQTNKTNSALPPTPEVRC